MTKRQWRRQRGKMIQENSLYKLFRHFRFDPAWMEQLTDTYINYPRDRYKMEHIYQILY